MHLSIWKCLLFWIFTLSVLCPVAGYGQTESYQKIQIEGFQASYNEFLATVAAYERGEKKGNKQERAAEVRKRIILRGIKITDDLIRYAQNIEKDSAKATEYKSVHEVLKQLIKLQSGLTNVSQRFIVGVEKGSEVTEKTVRPGVYKSDSAQSDFANYKAVGMNKRARLKGYLWRMKRGSIHQATHFGATYSAFMIATGLLTFVHLSADYAENPVALDQYLHHATDPLGAVSFAAFMATAGGVTRLLHKVEAGAIRRTMVPYIGMAAGLVASSLFYELATDKDLHQCIKSKFEDEGKCDLAFDKWVIHKKISQYTPTIISLTSSVALAGGLTMGVTKGIQAAGKTMGERALFSGMWMGPKVIAAKELGKKVFMSRYALSIGSFFVFLAIDKVIGPPIHRAFERFQFTKFDSIAWWDELFFHREYWQDYWHTENSEELFYIQDVFDVQATNLPTTHEYVSTYFKLWEQKNWVVAPSYNLGQCYAEGLFEVSKGDLRIIEENGQTTVELPFDDVQRKPESMRRCEVLAQPERLLSRYAETQQRWRQFLMRDFYESLIGWMEWSGRFSEDYLLSYLFYDYFMQSKQNESFTGDKPDLSFEKLKSVLFISEADKQDPLRTDNYYHSRIKHFLTRMACGQSWKTAQEPGSNELSSVRSKLEGSGSYGALKTPFGRAAQFSAPAVVKDYKFSTCDIYRDFSPFKTEKFLQEKLKDHESEFFKLYIETGELNPVFDYPWFTEGGTRYETLAELVYGQLDPLVWQNKKGRLSGFSNWWEATVKDGTQPVWDHYETEFKNLFFKEFRRDFLKKGSIERPGLFSSDGLLASLKRDVKLYFDRIHDLYAGLKGTDPRLRSKSLEGYLRDSKKTFQVYFDQFHSESNSRPSKNNNLTKAKDNLLYLHKLQMWSEAPESQAQYELWINEILGDAESAEDIGGSFSESQQQQILLIFQLVGFLENIKGEMSSFALYADAMSFDSKNRENFSSSKPEQKNPFISR